MVFSSIPFLYYFLPAMLLLYFAAGRRLRNTVLLLSSLLFYAWGEPRYVILMIAVIGFGYGMGLLLGYLHGTSGEKLFFIVGIAICVLTIGYFKYADFFIGNVNTLMGAAIPLMQVALPIGISFYTFQTISYLTDIYRGEIKPQKNLINYGAYISMFPQLIAGPIVRYQTVLESLEHRKIHMEDVSYGIRRFIIGLSKKLLLADILAELCEKYLQTADSSVLFVWMYALAFALQIYLDFSGYSDMAIGLGRLLGFRFLENFNYPFIAENLTEFWRRWHISLGSWFRDYVYIPLGGNRVCPFRWMINILIVWGLTGFWHGASWNFVLWGIYFGVLLMLEKTVLQKLLQKLPAMVSRMYTVIALLVSFVIFNGNGLVQTGRQLRDMFGLGGLPAVSTDSLYCLRSYGIVYLIAILCSTPIPSRAAEYMRSRKKMSGMWSWAEMLGQLVLLLLCTAAMVDSSFQPFLYFRF